MRFDSCVSLHDTVREIDWLGVKERLKPGAHVASITSSLGHHVETARMEDAGFEIRDCLLYLGSGGAMMVALARKPLVGTVASNVLQHGVGGINVDGCRVSGEPWKAHSATGLGSVKFFTQGETPVIEKFPHQAGRWPANCLHDGSEGVIKGFPQGSKSPDPNRPIIRGKRGDNIYGGQPNAEGTIGQGFGDSGSASRYFYRTSTIADLTSYITKLITPLQGHTLVSNLPQEAIISLNHLGFNTTNFDNDAI